MMKTILNIALLISVLFCSGQHTNLSYDEMADGVKFNNVTLGDIMETAGDLSSMQNLLGSDIQERPNPTAPYLAKFLWNENISFGFQDDSDTGNDYYLTYIIVKNSSVVVNVQGLSVRIGDDRSKFGRYQYNPNSKSYNFLDADTGSASLSFKIDEQTNKVSEIRFTLY